MRIENQYSRKITKKNSSRKNMISKNLQIQERKFHESMKEIERAEKEAWKKAHGRIVG